MTARVDPPETQLVGDASAAPPMTRLHAPHRDQSSAFRQNLLRRLVSRLFLQRKSRLTHPASFNFFTPSSQAALSTVFRSMTVATSL
jgi:hypothetical protein